MKTYLYNFYEQDGELDFIIESNANKETMENIEMVSDLIWREIEDEEEMPSLSQQEKALYDKYFERYAGEFKILIMKNIVEEEGYTWETPNIVKIEL